MASKKKGSGKQDNEGHSNFVPVVLARNEEEAMEYQELLGDHDIFATFTMSGNDGGINADALRSQMSRGIPVMVPDVLLDEASEIIADREDVDEFAVDGEGFDDDDDCEYDEGFDGTLDDSPDDDDDDDL